MIGELAGGEGLGKLWMLFFVTGLRKCWVASTVEKPGNNISEGKYSKFVNSPQTKEKNPVFTSHSVGQRLWPVPDQTVRQSQSLKISAVLRGPPPHFGSSAPRTECALLSIASPWPIYFPVESFPSSAEQSVVTPADNAEG